MRILITGATGQLGQALATSTPAGYTAKFLDRRDWDLRREGEASKLLIHYEPEVVINTAAYTQVDRAEGEPELAHRINAQAVGELATGCTRYGIRLIHISTDFVFDGLASSPYQVDAQTRPLNVYGESKLAGEKAVMASGAEACILRTAWVYHYLGANFVTRMLQLMRDGRTLSVVSDQVGTPTSATTLANAVWKLSCRTNLPPVLHWTDAGVASWYDLAAGVQEFALDLGLLRKATQLSPTSSDQYPTPARRPAYSVLDTSLTYELLGVQAVHWRTQLGRTLRLLALRQSGKVT